ncbi:MAG: lysophospholipid acyltransferase family protein [Pseudomonadota bacterium]
MSEVVHNWKFKLKVAAFKGLLKTLWTTTQVEKIVGEAHLDQLICDDQPVILCYWHQAHVMGLQFVLNKRKRDGLKLSALVSPSRDGEMAAQAMKDWGVDVVRGSSSRTGAQALRDLYQIIKGGYSPVITPDGPRGPAFEFKSGAVMLSQIAKVPMLPIAVTCNRAWHLNSWDRFMLPKPFSKVTIAIGEPVQAPKRMDEQQQETIRLKMENTIKSLEQANSYTD